LLNAFATFKKVTSASNAKLLLLGRGDQEQYLRQLAVDLGIVGEVNFLGIRNDIPDIMSFADCFVLASRHEGFPLVILEAMASKLPIVCTNFLGGRDIIHNGVEGLVTEVGDTTAFADSMKKIYENEVLRKELVKNASIKVQEFGIEKYVDKLLAL
jgi:glycosyltransferase involved in cell wall biosynthesis